MVRESSAALRLESMTLSKQSRTVSPLAALLLLTVFDPALGASIAVSTVQDAVALDAQCSLREAITSANTDQAPFAGAGECAAGSGPDVITLPAGTYAIARAGALEDLNATGDFDLRSSITLVGASPGSTRISGGLLDRVFHVIGDGHVVALRDLSVSLGVVPDGPEVAQRRGGGLLASGSSTTTLDRVVVEFNSGGSGTALGNPPGDGGGLACIGNARLFVRNSIVRLNSAGNARAGGSDAGRGGGIYGVLCQLDVTRSRIAGNTSGDGVAGGAPPGEGGGITIGFGSLSLVDSVLADNVTGGDGRADGGGLAAFAATVTLSGSSVVGNRAHRGGGIAGRAASNQDGPNVSVRNSTFSGNVAVTGGAIRLAESGVVDLRATTLADNTATTAGAIAFADCGPSNCRLIFRNSVFLRNGEAECALDLTPGSSEGFNAFTSVGVCGAALASDRVVDAAALGPLDEGYAATPVHLPPAASPLIDAGSCVVAGVTIDQAGNGRPQQYPVADAADGCDIGAIERRTDPVFVDGFE